MPGESPGPKAVRGYDLESFRRGHIGPGGQDLRGRPVVVFDLETRRGIERGNDRSILSDLGMSVGVTFNYQDGFFRTYGEQEAEDLVEELRAAETVVGYNLIGFDYEVLAGQVPGFDHRRLHTLDLMLDLQRRVGFRPRLGHVLETTLHVGKTGDGLEALQFYRDGAWDRLIDYCLDDVALTRALLEYGRETGHVLVEVNGTIKSIPVEWCRNSREKGLFD
jgi:DEAD/DEAH box helicase domain-containing protein